MPVCVFATNAAYSKEIINLFCEIADVQGRVGKIPLTGGIQLVSGYTVRAWQTYPKIK